MSDHTQRPAIAGGDAHDDSAVGSLLRLAGRREPVPADRMQRLKIVAHGEWRRQLQARRRRRGASWSLGGLAAAAAIALAVRGAESVDPATPTDAAFAVVESLGAKARLSTDPGGAAWLRVGDRVAIGPKPIAVEAGIAALRLPGGATMRFDRESTFRLTAADVVALERGAVYVDSGGTTALEVRTPMGVVHDVGTKFEVRVTTANLRVRVREGGVQVRRDRQRYDGRPGDEMVLGASGEVTRRAIPLDGPEWGWTTDAHTPFELEGHSLREFLDWVAAEKGWRLHFADAVVEDSARTTTLHGSIQGLTPEEALAAVMATSGVEHQLEGDVLSVRLRAGARR